MTAVISTTYDDKYLWYLPLTTFLWNKLGVDVICFMPRMVEFSDKIALINKVQIEQKLRQKHYFFNSPTHKEATYSQCSRLYAACLDLPEDEVLISGDVDMAVLKNIFTPNKHGDYLTIIGDDLVPNGQYPICYCYGTVKAWRDSMSIHNNTYQQCLDNLLGDIECESFRGNYWGKDQETLFNELQNDPKWLVQRSNGQNQWATKRYDRDDAYILDRLSPDTIDYHMNRPGFEEGNFQIILTIMKYHFPNENFQWLIDFNEQYKKLL